jgi:hypothetical protein
VFVLAAGGAENVCAGAVGGAGVCAGEGIDAGTGVDNAGSALTAVNEVVGTSAVATC